MRAEEAIKARLAELEEVKASYLQYLHVRIKEEDWHGAWDCAVNLSEVSCERDGLERALRAIEGEEKGWPDLEPLRCKRCKAEMPSLGHLQSHFMNCPGRKP